VNSNRRLSDHARASIAGNLRAGMTWGRVRAEFLEPQLAECEALVGLKQPHPDFRAAIVDASFLALCLHSAPPKRPAVVRKEMAGLAKRATEAASALRRLNEEPAAPWHRFTAEPPPEPLATLLAPATLDRLRDLAEVAQWCADHVLMDVGGPGRKVAFDIFIRVLADAYLQATGRPAGLTWSEYRNRYEGKFWALIDQLLPTVSALVGDSFAPLTELARGRQIQRILTLMDTSPTTPTR
jgi:hypothetical protein